MLTDKEAHIVITSEADIIRARKVARDVAKAMGFRLTDITRIVTAVSELARNIARYAGQGEMIITQTEVNGKKAMEIIFSDQGPGIEDVELAMSEGYSSSKSMGLGLPGAKRLMDELVIESVMGQGCKISIKKFL